MSPSSPHLTDHDLHRLRALVDTALRDQPTGTLDDLHAKLTHAVAAEPAALPADRVTLGSFVRIEDIYTGEVEEYTLTYPEHADIGTCRLSVLSPVGSALLGAREGAIVDWPTPGGIRRLKVHRVTQPALAVAEG